MLGAFQDAFVELAADATLRQAFCQCPETILDRYRLSARERSTLLAIDRDALERYARSLIAKRRDEVARVVPLTRRVVPQWSTLYERWAANHPARGLPPSPSPGIAEALRAERALFELLLEEPHACYAAELWCFEIRGAASRRDGEIRELRTRFDLARIAADVARGTLPIDPVPCATVWRFEVELVRSRPA